ncbi:MAG: hypothetical protein AAF078_14785 [Planctomycetota bacterium]
MSWFKRKLFSLRTAWWQYFRNIEWQRHKKTLSDEEVASLHDGSHPSLSHDRDADAREILKGLEDELRSRSLSAQVELGYYHLNRLIFTVEFPATPPDPKQLPRFFHGFEVFYFWPERLNKG